MAYVASMTAGRGNIQEPFHAKPNIFLTIVPLFLDSPTHAATFSKTMMLHFLVFNPSRPLHFRKLY